MKSFLSILLLIASDLPSENLDTAPTKITETTSMTICTVNSDVATSGLTGYLSNLFNTTSYPDRWNCGSWSEFEGWFMIISDFSIFTAYLSIPLLLTFIFWKRKVRDQIIPFKNNIILFACFILFCGLTHLIEVVIFWEPIYRVSSLIKFFTGVVSWVTVLSLAQAIPLALTYKSPEELEKEIAQRKMVEKDLKTTNEELDAFTHSVSHDLRAPLRAINGYANALKEDLPNLDENAQNHLNRIAMNATKMGQLIDNLIEFSRATSKITDFQNFSSLKLLNEIISMDKDLAIVQTNETSMPMIYGDESMIAQVFQNLLSNAVKYSKNEENQLVRVYGESNKTHVSITFEDNGVGFDMKYSDKLFEVFHRLHSDLEFEGNGIGLSLCKRIIDMHNGEITFKSTPEKGAIFSIVLPIRKSK